HLGHAFQHTGIIQPLGKLQQQQLSSFLELDGPALELHIGLDLIPFLQKLLGMLSLEIEVMVIRIGSKANLLDLGGLALSLLLLFLFLLFVKEFIIIDDLTNGGIRSGGDLDKIELLLLRHLDRLLHRINADGYVIADQSYLRHPDHMVGTMFLLLFFSKTWIEIPSRGSRWKCHLLFLVLLPSLPEAIF